MWDDRVEQLKKLAFIDESERYKVDQTGIFYDPLTTKFVLLTATGCSCWDGEYDEERFDSLDSLETSLITDSRDHNPTLMGVRVLMAEARLEWAKCEHTFKDLKLK